MNNFSKNVANFSLKFVWKHFRIFIFVSLEFRRIILVSLLLLDVAMMQIIAGYVHILIYQEDVKKIYYETSSA